MNILFQGFFRRTVAAFKAKATERIKRRTPQPATPKPAIPEPVERRRGFAKWLLTPNDSPRNIISGGKEMMLRLAEEKRERRRARNRRLAGIA